MSEFLLKESANFPRKAERTQAKQTALTVPMNTVNFVWQCAKLRLIQQLLLHINDNVERSLIEIIRLKGVDEVKTFSCVIVAF